MKPRLILSGIIMLGLAILFNPLVWIGLFGLILIIFGIIAEGTPETG